LERDAFLYVSDFMDLEQQDEDLDEAIPANRPVTEARPRNGAEAGGSAINNDEAQPGEFGAAAGEELEASSAAAPGNSAGASSDFRGRRRRRGRGGERGGRGERPARSEVRSEVGNDVRTESSADFSSEPVTEPRPEPRTDSRNERSSRGDRAGRDSRFQRPTPAARTGRDYDYGRLRDISRLCSPASRFQIPTPGLGQSQTQGAAATAEISPTGTLPVSSSIPANFPEDEPIFASDGSAAASAVAAEPLHEHEHALQAEVHHRDEAHLSAPSQAPEVGHEAHEAIEARNQTRPQVEDYPALRTPEHDSSHGTGFAAAPKVAQDFTQHPAELSHEVMHAAGHGAVEEQEIEEEEVDLASYGEEPGDDDGFEETEEETHAPGGERSDRM